ncbi:MAG: hypothetical protein AABW84_01120 [Nanoarchaeota archaeon]
MIEEKIEPKLGDPIPDEWLKKAEVEIKSKTRTITLDEFHGQKNVEIAINHPTTKDDTSSVNLYSKVYNRLLRDPEMLTRAEMKKLLEQKGLWGEEQEKIIDNIREEMRAVELQVVTLRAKNKNPNKATVNRLKKQWYELQNKIRDMVVERENYYSNTVEGRAEEEQLKSKLSLCVKYPDGNRVWSSLDILDEETERHNVVTIMNAAMLFWMGLTQEIISDLPAKLIFGGETESENLQDN